MIMGWGMSIPSRCSLLLRMLPPGSVSIAQTSTHTNSSFTTRPHTIQHTSTVKSISQQLLTVPYHSRQIHCTHTTGDEEDLYVLTLLVSPRHHAEMSVLRRKWFPSQLLKVDAHVTLFHALPGSHIELIKWDIREAAKNVQRIEVKVGWEDVFRMRKGVGVEIDKTSSEIIRGVREVLRRKWNGENFGKRYSDRWNQQETTNEKGWLTDQDARKDWMGHYTIMNKEYDTERIGFCYRELTEEWQGSKGYVTGMRLWSYERGWWRKTDDFLFASHQINIEEQNIRGN